MIRTRLAGPVLAALTCAALVAGCSSDDVDSEPRPGTSGGNQETTDGTSQEGGTGTEPGTQLPQTTGDFGDAPQFTFPDSGPPADLQVEVLSEGEGPMVQPGAAVLADYAGIVWGGEETFDDSYSRGAPSLFSLSGVVQGWTDGIPAHPVGSRLLISIPPELGYGPSGGQPSAGIGPEDTIVFVIDLVEAYNPDQAGEADATVTTEAAELPVQVHGEVGEPATVTVPDGTTEPTEVEVITIAEGSGEVVAAGQSVAAAYAMTSWDGAEQDVSWPGDGQEGTGPYAGPVGQGYIVDATVDVPVGSRVLVLLPANDTQPATAWLLDILGAA